MNVERANLADARRFVDLPDPFPMYRGGELRRGRVAYETWGALNKQRSNAILLFTGLSPSAHAASSDADPSEGWWERMVGRGLAIDTDRWFVICVNSLGSCFGSSGPSSIDPQTGEPYRLRFPDLSIEDMARAGFETQRALGIERIDTLIGPSLGGMVVLAHAAQFPRAARRLISISGTAAASPFAIALRSIQREAILSDPEWRGGGYAINHPPAAGMRLARMLGMLTYRSAKEWRERFSRAPAETSHHPQARKPGPFAPEFSVQTYLDVHAEKFVRSFDANSYLYISRAMDRFDLSAHGGAPGAGHGVSPAVAALSRAGLESALVVGVELDMLFAIGEQRALAQAFEAAGVPTRFAPLDCLEGHDSFLIDIDAFGTEIRAFLDR